MLLNRLKVFMVLEEDGIKFYFIDYKITLVIKEYPELTFSEVKNLIEKVIQSYQENKKIPLPKCFRENCNTFVYDKQAEELGLEIYCSKFCFEIYAGCSPVYSQITPIYFKPE